MGSVSGHPLYYLHYWGYFNPIFIVEILYKCCASVYLFPTLCSVRTYWYLYINNRRIYPQKSENNTFKSCTIKRIKLKVCLLPSCWTVVKLKSMSVSIAITFWITQKFEQYISNVRNPLSNSAKKSFMSLMKEQRLRNLLFYFHLTH